MIITAIRCKKCKDVVFSRARHDFRWCSCKNCAIDGGQEDYIKITGEDCEVITLESNIKSKELYDDWSFSRDIFGILKENDFVENKIEKKFKTFEIME